jgi:hypothetical protein
MRKIIPAMLLPALLVALVAVDAWRAPTQAQILPTLGTGANPDPVHVVIGLDISLSNPLIDSQTFADKAAARVASEIRNLPPRSKVTIRTFGVYDARQNPLAIDRVISRRERPEDVARLVDGVIGGVPQLIRTGRMKGQQWTNILAFLDNISHLVDCNGMDTVVILVSDGIEDSEYTRLHSRAGALPMPETAQFSGCRELQILGIGQGMRSPQLTTRLRDEWEQWASAAGFQSFLGLNDW